METAASSLVQMGCEVTFVKASLADLSASNLTGRGALVVSASDGTARGGENTYWNQLRET